MWNGPYFRKLFLIISHQARCVLQYAVETWIKAFRFFIFFASSTTENTAPTLMAIAWIWFKIVLKNFSFVWLFFISRNYLIICFCKITLSRSSLNLTVAALWKTTLTSSSNNLRVQLQFNLHFHLNLSKVLKQSESSISIQSSFLSKSLKSPQTICEFNFNSIFISSNLSKALKKSDCSTPIFIFI